MLIFRAVFVTADLYERIITDNEPVFGDIFDINLFFPSLCRDLACKVSTLVLYYFILFVLCLRRTGCASSTMSPLYFPNLPPNTGNRVDSFNLSVDILLFPPEKPKSIKAIASGLPCESTLFIIPNGTSGEQ